MKIWYQSAATLEQKATRYRELLTSHIKAIALPDTEVHIRGMRSGTHITRDTKDHIGYVYVQNFNKEQFVSGALEAQQSGYDAFFVGTIPDIGYEECRSVVDIPVVAYGQSSLMAASMLGTVAGIVNFATSIDPLLRRNAMHYNMDKLLGPIVALEGSLDAVVAAYDNPAELIGRFIEAAREAISQGAEVIIPGPGPLNVLMAHNGVSRVDEVPVIDSVAVGIKMCEMRAQLYRAADLRPCRNGYFLAQPREELVEHLRGMFVK